MDDEPAPGAAAPQPPASTPAEGVPGWLRSRQTAPAPGAPPPPPAPVRRRRPLVLAGLGLLLVALLGLGGVAVLRPRLLGLRPVAPSATPRPETPAPPAAAFFPAGGDVPSGATPGVDSPDVDPPPTGVTLAAAYQAEQEGRYEDAIAAYRPIAEAQAGSPVGADARWHLAVCLYHAGQYDAAIESFAQFARSYPGTPRALRAAFWAARAHMDAGRPRAALAEFVSYAPVAGPLRATTLLLAADAATGAGDTQEARRLLGVVLGETGTRLDRIGAWTRLAALDKAAGNGKAAAGSYAAIAAVAQVPAYRAAMRLQAGLALLDAGDSAAGRATLRAVLAEQPDQPAAYRALHRLVTEDSSLLGGAIGYDVACRIAYAAGQYSEAIGYCDRFREAEAPGPARADAAWWTARSFEA
ncbi:MAG TPA: tetratricopeptide repeat protein, partial [Chloroflexia bacterium]|nr:tetratricopeptide repeat protein [Chloroflexia bacterium]